MTFRLAGPLALVPTFVFILNQAEAADITVEATRPSLTAPGVDAAKARADLQPGGASIVDAESYKTGRASTWSDMLGYAPGVFIQPRYSGDESRLSIRGSGLQRTFHGRGVLVLVDSVPANLADGGVDFQAVAPILADHIAVYRGAQGQAYGSTTLGGAIAVESPTGRTAPPLTVSAEGGSYQYARGTVAVANTNGPWDVWVGATAAQAQGYRDHAQSQDQRVQGNVGYCISDVAENRAFIGWSNSISELPGSLTRAQFEDDPQQATTASIAGDQHRDYPLVRVADRFAYDDGVQRVEAAVAYSRKDLFHPIFQVIDQLSHDGLGSLRYALQQQANRLTVLATYGVGLTRAQQFINVSGDRGAQTDDGYQRSTNAVLDIGDELTLSQTHVSVGIQLTRATRAFDDHLSGGAFGTDKSDSFTYSGANPRVGVRQDLADHAQVYANVSRSYEPPSFGEITAVGNITGLLALDAQQAVTAEVGTRGELERASWDISAYYAWIRDELISYQVAPNVSRTINADHTVHAGLEVGGEVVPCENLVANDRLRLRAAYLLNWFHFVDDAQFGNDAIAGVPPQYLHLEALYEWNGGWYAGPSTQVVQAAYVDHANTTEAPGWATVGAKAGYRGSHGFSGWIEVRNLLNQNYSQTYGVVTTANASSAVYNPGDGRSFYAGAGWRW